MSNWESDWEFVVVEGEDGKEIPALLHNPTERWIALDVLAAFFYLAHLDEEAFHEVYEEVVEIVNELQAPRLKS